MAISLYMGVMGSGKTYEVIHSVIVPAVASGRRVITNIKGINEERIHDYCRTKLKSNNPGRVLFTSSEDVLNDDFFPYYNESESVEQVNTFCEYGDLICLDELWSIWPSDSRLSESHRRFISMHRHMTHKITGVSCDLIIVNQGVDGVPRYLKERIEATYRMTKLKSLGLAKSYRVDVFSGAKLFKSNKVSTRNYQYKKSIFALYKSYESENGREAVTDKRQNAFSSIFLWVKIGAVLLIVMVSVYTLQKVWAGMNHETPAIEQQASPTAIIEPSVPVMKEVHSYSSTWHIVGVLKTDYLNKVILTDNSGRLRILPANQFDGEGMALSGNIDGEIITYFTGN